MSVHRRTSIRITYEVLKYIKDNSSTSRWDLEKVLGNKTQFDNYLTDFLIKEGMVIETNDGKIYNYTLTELGEHFFILLSKDDIVKAFLRISGKRLKD